MSELKATTAQEIVQNEKDCDYMDELFGGVKMPPTQVYLKSEVDAVLAKKDMEIFNLKEKLSYIKEDSTFDRDKHNELLKSKDEEIRRLNHKYWDDKADEAAKMKRLIQNGEIIYLDEYCNEKDWRIMHKVWEDEETKCRAKAEKFKEEK